MIGPTNAELPTTFCHAAAKLAELQCSGFQTATGYPNIWFTCPAAIASMA